MYRLGSVADLNETPCPFKPRVMRKDESLRNFRVPSNLSAHTSYLRWCKKAEWPELKGWIMKAFPTNCRKSTRTWPTEQYERFWLKYEPFWEEIWPWFSRNPPFEFIKFHLPPLHIEFRKNILLSCFTFLIRNILQVLSFEIRKIRCVLCVHQNSNTQSKIWNSLKNGTYSAHVVQMFGGERQFDERHVLWCDVLSSPVQW